jgi:flagellar basal-body rod protein FlgB
VTLLANALGIHEKALQVKSARLETIARDIDFRGVLEAVTQTSMNMTATQPRHFRDGALINPLGEMYRVPYNNAFDGNTVELHVEQAHYGKAAADYQATLSFLESRVGSIRKALKGE